MKKTLQRIFLAALVLIPVLPVMARPLHFMLELWKEAPASYMLENMNYRGSVLTVKKRRMVGIAIENRPGKTVVFFKPSQRQVVEASTPALRQPNEIEAFVDAFLLKNPITMTFNRDNSIELNLQKNLQAVEAFYQGYCASLANDSPVRALAPGGARAVVDMNSQILLGLFINQMVFSTEFEEGRHVYRFPEGAPVREAMFDLQSTLYGISLLGEAIVTDGQGKPLTKNTYRFDFAQELNALEGMRMEVQSLDSDVRDVYVLTR